MTELDNTKSCYQLIKTMTKFKKLHDAHLHKHDLLIVTLTVLLQYNTVHRPTTSMMHALPC